MAIKNDVAPTNATATVEINDEDFAAHLRAYQIEILEESLKKSVIFTI
jgi:hypothetical protein